MTDGRADDAGRWPSRKPVASMLLFLVVFVGGAVVAAYRYTTVLTPLQQFYFGRYVYSWPPAAAGLSKRVPYAFLTDTTTQTLATDATPSERVAPVRARYTYGQVFDLLRTRIYDGRTPTQVLTDVARPAAGAAMVVFVVGLLMTGPVDRKRITGLRNGIPVRGRQSVDAETFNRLTPADGLRIRQGAGVKQRW